MFKSLTKPITVYTSHFNDSWLPTSWLIALTIISGEGTTKHNAFYVYIHTYISVNVSSDDTTITVVLLTYQTFTKLSVQHATGYQHMPPYTKIQH